jgi:hypothetical protein
MSAFTLDFEKHPQLRFRIDNFAVPASGVISEVGQYHVLDDIAPANR